VATQWQEVQVQNSFQDVAEASQEHTGHLDRCPAEDERDHDGRQNIEGHRGLWTSGTPFSCHWLRTGKPISRTKKAQYELSTADQNKEIFVWVTGKRSGSFCAD